MLNEVQIGNNIDYVASQLTSVNTVAGGLILSGEAVVVGQVVGVAASSATLNTDLIDVQHRGVFNLPVVGPVTLGANVYIAPGTGLLSTTNTGVFFGYALAAIGSVTAVVPIKLKH